MSKIIIYELRRLLWNKVFFGILVICLGFGFSLLQGEIIMGVSNTAPFSPWSFGSYLSQLIPVICLGELFFLTFFFSDKKRKVNSIIQTTPISPWHYALIRCGTVLAGTLLLAICAIILYLVSYSVLFGKFNYGALVFPAFLALFPVMLFCLGVGYKLGNIHSVFLYLLMFVVFVLSAMPIQPILDFSMGSFFKTQPLQLGILDPAFTVTYPLLCGRVMYTMVGVLLLVCGRRKKFSNYNNIKICKNSLQIFIK